MQKTLLLFDIDGTLLTTGGCGERALKLAARDYFGKEEDLRGIEIAGRTDTLIARQLLQRYSRDESEVMALLAHYLRHLPTLLPEAPGRLLPGVTELLGALRERDDVILALLTGNLERGAQHKLAHYGVWECFEFGAFADDHHDRNQLGPVALRRAQERGYTVDPARTFVIGDTPYDVACARACGARAIGVATGGASYETLAATQPDALLRNFSDLPASLASMGLSQR